MAIRADEALTGIAELRWLDARMRDIERQPGPETLDVEMLMEALARSRKELGLLATSPLRDDFR